jgi:hypothetical protein
MHQDLKCLRDAVEQLEHSEQIATLVRERCMLEPDATARSVLATAIKRLPLEVITNRHTNRFDVIVRRNKSGGLQVNL